MDGVTVKHEPELFTVLESSPIAVENHGDCVDGVSSNMGGDGSMMDLSANKSIPASGVHTVIRNSSQLTIFYNGSICIYDGIPAEKVHEIMRMAAAAAKSTETKKIGKQSPLLTRPSSPHGTTDTIAMAQALCFPAKSTICKLQEFPIARRHSLQRFLEKRRDRLGSKAPYPSSPTTKVADNIENNYCADNAQDSVSMKRSEEEFQPTISAS